MKPVLPPIRKDPRLLDLRDPRDLLTDAQKEELDNDLRIMARQRRAAEAAAAHISLA